MIRRLDDLWCGLLYRVNRWVLCRVEAYSRRDMGRAASAKWHRDAAGRLRQEVAWQKAHLN